jgi:hypothetical protein
VSRVGAGGIGSPTYVGPEGHVLQIAGQQETVLTEVTDLDNVPKVREYGNPGLYQVWKDLKNFRRGFPIYEEGIQKGGGI